jgi:intermediate peptidase
MFCHNLSYHTIAGYYSYLYARCFATTIWHEICQDDPLSRSTGSALRDKFLQYGGAKDPSALLKDFVGDSVIRNSGGGIIPDISSLRKEVGL